MTTEVAFDEVRLQDVPNPLWLPIDVNVYMEINKQKYRVPEHSGRPSIGTDVRLHASLRSVESVENPK